MLPRGTTGLSPADPLTVTLAPLHRRLLTAIVVIPPVVWAVLRLDSMLLALALATFVLWGAWEWVTLSNVSSRLGRFSYVAIVAAFLYLAWRIAPLRGATVAVLGVAVAWWLIRLLVLLRFRGSSKKRAPVLGAAAVGVLTLVPAWLAMVVIHRSPTLGPGYLLYVLVLVWTADTGAFFAGRRWGRTPLAPRISPAKTLEGVYGALVATTLLSFVVGVQIDAVLGVRFAFVVLGALAALFSVLGDLSESALKRSAGVKESGGVFPGHGGMLDRIDSLTAAAPVFALGMLLTTRFLQ